MSKSKVTVSSKVSQFIEEWDRAGFDECRNIYIEAGVGVGKSFFTKNDLYSYAKEHNQQILFLIHRTKCVDAFENELKRDGKLDHITVATYQKLGTKLKDDFENLLLLDLSIYSWIVCDEAHFFVADAPFNHGTNSPLNKIFNQSKATKIFMSATGEIFLDYCKLKKIKLKKYSLPINYKYIKSLQFYYENEKCDGIQAKIDECIDRDKKCLFFIQSATKCYEYFEKYKDISVFSCSKSNSHAKYMNEESNISKLDSLLQNEILPCQFLFTSTAMDAGVNINNSDINEVLVDVWDVDTLKQCIGRKRLQSVNDYINLTVRAFGSHKKQKTKYEKAIEIADKFTKHGAKTYIEINQGNQDTHNMIIDDMAALHNKKVNELKYVKFKKDIERIDEMESFAKHGYIKFIAKELKFKKWTLLREGGVVEQANDLEQYLESLVGKKLDKDAQQKLIEKVDLKDGRGRQQKTYTMLNQYFQDNDIEFQIIPKRNKSERYWEISKCDWTQTLETA